MKVRGAALETIKPSAPYAEFQSLRLQELELGAPGPTELRVRITAAGVCHSDHSLVNGNRPRHLPMLLGHEAAGVVEHVGLRGHGSDRGPARGHGIPAALRGVRGRPD